MSQIENLHIMLQKHDNQTVFFPGDALIGILGFRVPEKMNAKSVRIILDCTGRVKWYIDLIV